MMDSVGKTKSHERIFLPVGALEPNSENPNEMTDAEFNLLCDNVEKMGLTDPILVRKHPDKEGYYRIVGGHHRWEVAKLFGYDEVPCTVITDPSFDDDQERFQMVRMNVIHGHMSPKKFIKLYQSLSSEYADDVASELFGFADQEEFRKMVSETANSLPDEMQAEFKAAAKEIKTIDELSLLLNSLFSKYGETLPFNYMFLDYEGKDCIWVRINANQFDTVRRLSDACKLNKRAMDNILEYIIAKVSDPENAFNSLLQEAIAASPEVAFSDDVDIATLDYLDE